MKGAAASGTNADKILENGSMQESIASLPWHDLVHGAGLKPIGLPEAVLKIGG